MRTVMFVVFLCVTFENSYGQSPLTINTRILREARVFNHAICRDKWQKNIDVRKTRFLLGRNLYIGHESGDWYEYRKFLWFKKISVPDDRGDAITVKFSRKRIRSITVDSNPKDIRSKIIATRERMFRYNY